MKKSFKTFFAASVTAVALFTQSCSSDSDNPITDNSTNYSNYIILSNEGTFNSNNATVDALSKNYAENIASIYAKSNNNEALGDVLQSIGFKNNYAFLVINNSNKVVVVNRTDFKKVTTLTQNIQQPRSIAFNDQFIYITNHDYSGEKSLSIFKLSDFSFVQKHVFTTASQGVVEAQNNIFVENASDGYGNQFTYINGSTNQVENTITLPSGDLNKLVSYNNKVYALAGGLTDSYIYEINASNGNISQTTTLTGIANARKLAIDQNTFYYTSENKIYKLPIGSSTIPTTPLVTVTNTSPYSTLYGFNVIDGAIFTSEANGFTQPSTVAIYNTAGQLVKSFTSGMGTNGFYKNY